MGSTRIQLSYPASVHVPIKNSRFQKCRQVPHPSSPREPRRGYATPSCEAHGMECLASRDKKSTYDSGCCPHHETPYPKITRVRFSPEKEHHIGAHACGDLRFSSIDS